MSNGSQRWDVVIYELATGKVETIAGTDLPESGSFHTVDKRLNLVLGRINDHYSVAKVPVGKYKVGDELAQEHRVFPL